MSNDKVSEFELRKFFLEYYRKSRRSLTSHPDFKIGQYNYHLLSENGREASQMFYFLCKIYDLNSDLEKTHTFIRRFPLKKYYEKNDIDQLDYIQYHYEVFIHKIHTLLEVMKLWLNDFYKIGLNEKDCNWNALKGYSKIQKSPAKIIVDNYYKSFKHTIKLRHLNTHRAFFKDTKKDELKSDLMIYSSYEKYGIDVGDEFRRMVPKSYLNYELKRYRRDMLKNIKEGVDIAKAYSDQFITILQTEFFARKIKENSQNEKTDVSATNTKATSR